MGEVSATDACVLPGRENSEGVRIRHRAGRPGNTGVGVDRGGREIGGARAPEGGREDALLGCPVILHPNPSEPAVPVDRLGLQR